MAFFPSTFKVQQFVGNSRIKVKEKKKEDKVFKTETENKQGKQQFFSTFFIGFSFQQIPEMIVFIVFLKEIFHFDFLLRLFSALLIENFFNQKSNKIFQYL